MSNYSLNFFLETRDNVAKIEASKHFDISLYQECTGKQNLPQLAPSHMDTYANHKCIFALQW